MKRLATLASRYWNALAVREQQALRRGAALLALVLVWAVLIAPALSGLRGADAAQRALAQQIQTMQRQQARARVLQALPPIAPEAQLAGLKESLAALGAGATLEVQGTQLTLRLSEVPGTVFAQWLAQSALAGHLQPVQAHLSRTGAQGVARWSGSLVYRLAEPGA